ncbi:hypothetical protein Goari_007832, partial [Gossypium aridum]|nr:hypothetical protein [Gossypium aridum]
MSSEKLPVELSKGVNGLEEIILREARGSSAEVYLYGGHVTSWKNEHGEELLFVSSKVLCGGNVRTMEELVNARFSMNMPQILLLSLKAISKVRRIICFLADLLHGFVLYSSYEFHLRVALGLGGDLMLTSRIRNMNTDGKPFTFAFAYHTYFSVSDI